MQNQKVNIRNKSGFPGVHFDKEKKKWRATAKNWKKAVCLGCYVGKIEAALARLTWEVNCPGWKCNHGSDLVKSIREAWPEFNEKSIL